MNEDGVNGNARQAEGWGQESSGDEKDEADDICDTVRYKLEEFGNWVREMKSKGARDEDESEHDAPQDEARGATS